MLLFKMRNKDGIEYFQYKPETRKTDFSSKTKHTPNLHAGIPFLEVHPREERAYVHMWTYT